MQVERSIIINCPVPEVFAFLTDVENAVKWQDSTVETHQTSPGPMGVGTSCATARLLDGDLKKLKRVLETS